MVGSAATLVAALWVSWQLGLTAQGEFGLTKSWFDAAAAWACIGVPQGLLHLQYLEHVPPAALKRWIARFLGMLALAALVASAVLWAAWRPGALIAASVPFAVAHLIARSLILRRRGAEAFGIATAVPSLAVLAGVAWWVWHRQSDHFDALLLGAAVAAGVITFIAAWPRGQVVEPVRWSTRQLWAASLQSWFQQALSAAFAAALLSTIAASGHAGEPLGAASLGLQAYQILVTLAAYVSPLLYDRLAGRDERLTSPRAQTWLGRWTVAALGIVLATAAVGWYGGWFDRASHMIWTTSALMLLAGSTAAAARLGATVLLARGRYSELSLQAFARLLTGVLLIGFALRALPAPLALGFTLLVVESLTWWRCRTLAAATAGQSAAAAKDNGA